MDSAIVGYGNMWAAGQLDKRIIRQWDNWLREYVGSRTIVSKNMSEAGQLAQGICRKWDSWRSEYVGSGTNG